MWNEKKYPDRCTSCLLAKNYKPTWTKPSLRLVFVLRWNYILWGKKTNLFVRFLWKNRWLKKYNRTLAEILKHGSQERVTLWCRCSSFLSLAFVEIKKSFTRTLLVFNSKNFRIICYWKKTDENEPI